VFRYPIETDLEVIIAYYYSFHALIHGLIHSRSEGYASGVGHWPGGQGTMRSPRNGYRDSESREPSLVGENSCVCILSSYVWGQDAAQVVQASQGWHYSPKGCGQPLRLWNSHIYSCCSTIFLSRTLCNSPIPCRVSRTPWADRSGRALRDSVVNKQVSTATQQCRD
jgi:hypothetical protein